MKFKTTRQKPFLCSPASIVRLITGLMVVTLSACGGGGGNGPSGSSTTAISVTDSGVYPTSSPSGSGDPGSYFPIELGASWTYSMHDSQLSPSDFVETDTVTASSMDGLRTIFTIHEAPDNDASTDNYFFKDPGGITQTGSSSKDSLVAIVGTFRYSVFALLDLPSGTTLTLASRQSADYGEDLDGDGRNETMDTLVSVRFAGYESVDVPAGHYDHAAKFVYQMNTTIHSSRIKTKTWAVNVVETEWNAPGVGLVKGNTVGTNDDGSTAWTSTQELMRATVGGRTHGIGAVTNWNPLGPDTPVDTANPVGDGPATLVAGASSALALLPVIPTSGAQSWAATQLGADGTSTFSSELSAYDPSILKGGFSGAGTFDGINYLLVFKVPVTTTYGPAMALRARRMDASGHAVDSADLDLGLGQAVASAFDPARNRTLVIYSRMDLSYVSRIYGRFIDRDGHVGDEFTILNVQDPGANLPRAEELTLAFDGHRFLAVWKVGDISPPLRAQLKAAFIDAKTGLVQDTAFDLTSSSALHGAPSVVFDGREFVVAWVQQNDLSSASSVNQLRAMRVSTTGTLLDGPIQVDGVLVNDGAQAAKAWGLAHNATITGSTLAYANGMLWFAWEGQFNGHSAVWVAAARFSPEDWVINPAIQVSPPNDFSNPTVDARYPSMVALASGAIVVNWIQNPTIVGNKTMNGLVITPP